MARLASRALIINDDKLLVIKLKEHDNFWCLPGGKVEDMETTRDCLARELKEELGFDAIIGKLCFIHEGLLSQHNVHLFECIFLIDNPEGFTQADVNASHAFEIFAIERVSIINPDPAIRLLPDSILPNLKQALESNAPLSLISHE